MAEAVKGIDRILLMRPHSLRTTQAAGRLAFQTDHDTSSSVGADVTATKDGSIRSTSPAEKELSLNSIMARDDETRKKLVEAHELGELVEVWDIDKGSTPTGDKYAATYYQGILTEWSETAAADGSVAISASYAINGVGVRGEATLTADQKVVVQYDFKDTTIDTSV